MRNHWKLPRKIVKIDEKIKNPYENGKKSVFFEIPYFNSAWCQKSVFVRINPYVWQHYRALLPWLLHELKIIDHLRINMQVGKEMKIRYYQVWGGSRMSKKSHQKYLRRSWINLAVCGLTLLWMNRIIFNNLLCRFILNACHNRMSGTKNISLFTVLPSLYIRTYTHAFFTCEVSKIFFKVFSKFFWTYSQISSVLIFE